MHNELSSDKTECWPKSSVLDKIKMFKMFQFQEIWTNGESGDDKMTIIRGKTSIEKKDEADSQIDPLYNLGDRLIIARDLN